jgi:hypothetical protein
MKLTTLFEKNFSEEGFQLLIGKFDEPLDKWVTIEDFWYDLKGSSYNREHLREQGFLTADWDWDYLDDENGKRRFGFISKSTGVILTITRKEEN